MNNRKQLASCNNMQNKMRDLLNYSIDELLTERQKAIEAQNIARYRECNELINTWVVTTSKKLEIVEMLNDLKNESNLNSLESATYEG